jgi:anti-sigma factor ChrR (cupin superfamily)
MIQDDSGDEMKMRCAAHAVGALSAQEAAELDEHVRAGCPECEAQLQSFGRVASRLAFGADRQEPSENARERLWTLLGRMQQPQRAGTHATRPTGNGVVRVRMNEGEWKEVCPGVFRKHLFADEARGTVTSLFRLMPGARLPDHSHVGVEECVVLEGDFCVNEEVFGPGDYRCMMPGTADHDLYSRGGSLFLIVSGGYEGCGQPSIP